jgi:drug/metabolite transporter (DMT)-like permease
MGRSMMQPTCPPRRLGPGLLYASVPVLSWGFSFVVIKTTMHEIPPLTLAFLRFFFASLIVWPLLVQQKGWTTIAPADRLPFFLLGFFGVTTYFAFENYGLKYTSASHGALIIATIPLATEIYGIVHQRLAVKPMLIAASLTALAGVFLLVGSGGESSASPYGDLLMFGAVASWVAYSSLAAKLISRYPQLFVTFAIMVIGAVTLLPGALGEWLMVPYPFPSGGAWLGVAFLTIFCSVLGYHCWNLAIARLGVGMTSNLLYVMPLLGVSSGVLLLNEPLTPQILWGSLLIIGGVIWAHFADSRTGEDT